VDAFLRRSKRYGYCADDTPKISELFAATDQSLFERVLRNELHVGLLQPLLPEKKMISNHNLRARQHDRQLIRKSAHINDCLSTETVINLNCDFCVLCDHLLSILAPCTLVAVCQPESFTRIIWIWIWMDLNIAKRVLLLKPLPGMDFQLHMAAIFKILEIDMTS